VDLDLELAGGDEECLFGEGDVKRMADPGDAPVGIRRSVFLGGVVFAGCPQISLYTAEGLNGSSAFSA
jgi:hypothetical protein